MYNLSGEYYWDSDPETKEIVLIKNDSVPSTDVVLKSLPNEMRVKPEDLITFNVSDMPHPGKGVATTVGTAAIGTLLLGPVGLLMGAGAGAMTANKENKKDKKVYFQFRRDNDNNQYEYEGTIPSKLLYLLDGIIDSPNFGKNASLGGSTPQAISGVSSVNVIINPNDPTPTIERIKLFLEDGDWGNATQYCNAALDLFPTYSYFYILKYCAKNHIKKMDRLNNEAPEKLFGDDDFQKALRFSSDGPDDAKALYDNSLQKAFNDVAAKESNSLSSKDYAKMQQEMAAIKNYKPAQEKAEEYRLCSASALISEQNSEYLRTKGSTNSNDPKSLIEAIQKYQKQLAVVKSNQAGIKEYVEAGKGNPNDLKLEKTIETTIWETREQLYELACAYMAEDAKDSLEKAKKAFGYLEGFRNSSRNLKAVNQKLKAQEKAKELENLYKQASEAENAKDYDKAIVIYKSLNNYKDSQQKFKELKEAILEDKYNNAVNDFNSGNNRKAKKSFVSLGNYKYSKDYLTKIENAAKQKTRKIVAIVAALTIVVAGAGFGIHTYQVKKAEEEARQAAKQAAEEARQAKIEFEKKTEEMKPEVEKALANADTGIAAESYHTVGLKSDGTVVSTSIPGGRADYGQTDVDKWTDIVAVSAGYYHTVGLKSDGTVVSTTITDEDIDYGQTDVDKWTNIVAVSAGGDHTVGLKSDGTVVSTTITDEDIDDGQTKVKKWKKIVNNGYKYLAR